MTRPATRPVFIGGAGRSGTTLAVDLLGTHPHLSPVYETDFVLVLARMLLRPAGAPELVRQRVWQAMDHWTRSLPHRPHSKRSHETYRHGPHHVLFDRPFALACTEQLLADLDAGTPPRTALRRCLDRLFGRHAELDRKPRWINKTPGYVQHLDLLFELYPDLVFVHCLRDGRAATASAMTRPWGPKTWAQGAEWWVENVLAGLRFAARHPASATTVTYERLLAEPHAQLARLLGAVGEDPATAGAVLHGYQRDGLRFDPARARVWRDGVDPVDAATFEDRAGGVLDRLGYARMTGEAACAESATVKIG